MIREWLSKINPLRRSAAPTPSGPPPPARAPWEPRTLTHLLDPATPLPEWVRADPLAQRYRLLLAELPWADFPERDERARPWPGPKPQPRAPFAAAFLIGLDQQHPSLGALSRFLAEHPALLWLLTFPLVPNPTAPHGFDPAASAPSARRLARILRTLPNPACQFLLAGTLPPLRAAAPPPAADEPDHYERLVVGDTKHILAWVKENNPKVFIEQGRYDPERQPPGDPDCKLGVKRRRNRPPAEADGTPVSSAAPTPTTEGRPASSLSVADELYWGYASGVLATPLPDGNGVVLAELTQPFNASDVSYFHPLLADAEARLGYAPPFGVWDAAFDAHYVYDYFHRAGGFAAVPFVERGGQRLFDEQGLPLCDAGLGMPLKSRYQCKTTLVQHERGRYACPLLHPAVTGQVCPIAHPKWPDGGCLTTLATDQGARIRHQLDRDSEEFLDNYRQRSVVERINSQAVALGIERPKLRGQASIANRCTLTYVLLNLRTLARLRRNAATPTELAA